MKQTIQATYIPLLIFGGSITDVEGSEISVHIGLENTFDKAFGFERNLKIWGEIGVFPFNRKCSEDAKVKHELVELPDETTNLKANSLTEKLLQIERLNFDSVKYINANGYNGTTTL